MKQIIGLCLAVLMLCGSIALAETKDVAITREGIEENLTLTRHDSPWAFVIWYDASIIAPTQPNLEGDTDVFASTSDMQYRLTIQGYDHTKTLEEAAAKKQADLEAEGYTVSTVEDAGITSEYSLQVLAATGKEPQMMTAVLNTRNGNYFITMEYPTEAAEGISAIFPAMVSTFEVQNNG